MINRSIFSFFLLVATANATHAQWSSAHANAANKGFVNVDTIPANHIVGYANVGPVAGGANPVISANGTVYIGNTNGELIALRSDGTQLWKRQLDPGFGGIYASPVIGSDGSIYVVSVFTLRYRDGTYSFHSYSYLHKFYPTDGTPLGWVQFPLVNVALPAWVHGGVTSAPPNIWHFNGAEVIMVPVWYRVFMNWELRLIAFSTTLGVMSVQPVTTLLSEVTGEWSCPILCFNSPSMADLWPDPGVAIFEYPQGSPWIWVADGRRATVAYKFNPATTGFFEVYRFEDDQYRRSSPPVALDNAIAAVGTGLGVLKFERAGISIRGFHAIKAAPTRLFDGRLVVIDETGLMSVVNGSTITLQSQLNGGSIVSAAASCTHLFVASVNELATYDLKTMLRVARIPWTGGGGYAPLIGPSGRVYAMTAYGLFVFQGPTPTIGGGLFGTACSSNSVLTGGGGLIAR